MTVSQGNHHRQHSGTLDRGILRSTGQAGKSVVLEEVVRKENTFFLLPAGRELAAKATGCSERYIPSFLAQQVTAARDNIWLYIIKYLMSCPLNGP